MTSTRVCTRCITSSSLFIAPSRWIPQPVGVLRVLPLRRTMPWIDPGRRRSSIVSMAGKKEYGESLFDDDLTPEKLERVQAHQKAAPSLSPLAEARTVVDICRQGALSTISAKLEGYPTGSMVGFAADDKGRPVLAISSLSPHTADLEANPKCSLLLSRDLNDMGTSRVTVIGTAVTVPQAEEAAVREMYLKKHPNAFWVDFGDFRFVRLEPVNVRFVTNVGTFAQGASSSNFSAEQFAGAEVDPVAPFERPIADHMNKDHMNSLMDYVQHYIGLKNISKAEITALDSLGMRTKVEQGKSSYSLRLPFPRPAKGRKDVKDLLLEMSREVASAKSGAATE